MIKANGKVAEQIHHEQPYKLNTRTSLRWQNSLKNGMPEHEAKQADRNSCQSVDNELEEKFELYKPVQTSGD